MGTAGLAASQPGILLCSCCVFVYINKSHGFGAFTKVFLVVDLGQWWSVVRPIGPPKVGA